MTGGGPAGSFIAVTSASYRFENKGMFAPLASGRRSFRMLTISRPTSSGPKPGRRSGLAALSMHRRRMHRRCLHRRCLRTQPRSGRLDRRPALLRRTFLPGVTALTMVWLLGIGRKGKRQRNQWEDDPRSAESVHSCKPLFGHCGDAKQLVCLKALGGLGLYSAPVFSSIAGAGNIAGWPVAVCLVTNP